MKSNERRLAVVCRGEQVGIAYRHYDCIMEATSEESETIDLSEYAEHEKLGRLWRLLTDGWFDPQVVIHEAPTSTDGPFALGVRAIVMCWANIYGRKVVESDVLHRLKAFYECLHPERLARALVISTEAEA